MEEEYCVSFELGYLAFNIRKEVFGVFNFFCKNYEKNKAHNMLSLLLDFGFKNLCTMFSCSFEQGKAIVEKYNRKTLYPMLKCYNHLHPCLKYHY
jgi:hypothetical protein